MFFEEDVRIDLFGPACPLDVARPETWPTVRVIHLPTGIAVSKRGPRVVHNKWLAMAELQSLVEERLAG